MSEGKEAELQIKNGNTSKHVKLFLESYRTPSFGGLSSKEVQILVFKLFIDLELIKLEESDYDIARKLRIEPSKVKTLRFNYRLRYETFNDEIIKKYLKESKGITENVDYNRKRIRLKITNQLVRAHIIDQLDKINCIYDYGRNKDIIKLSVVDFFNWLQKYGYAKEEELKDALKETFSKKLLKEKEIEDKNVKQLIEHLIQDIKSPENWVKFITNLISVAIKVI